MIIEIKDLVKRYDELVALNHFDLKVAQGDILGLLGPNGSGKSTAINCMLSLLSYDKGTIKLFGQPMRPDLYAIKRKIGIVPQEIAVFEELTVKQNIDYYCGLYIKDPHSRKQHVEEAVKLVGLEDFTKFTPKKLSGGLKRRLNIACGIAHKPELIFLDEPTVAVDPQSRNKILESIRQLNQQGATVVYTTHYMEEVELLCNRIVIIDQGQVIAEGSKEALKQMIRTNEKLILEMPLLTEATKAYLKAKEEITEFEYDQTYLTISTIQLKQTLLDILQYLTVNQIEYGSIRTQEVTLNDVFLEITGKELRD